MLAARPSRQSVRPPARGSSRRPTRGRGQPRSPAHPPDSPIVAQPGSHSDQSACAGPGPELGGGQGQLREATAGPLGLYQSPARRGRGVLGPYHRVPREGVGSVNSAARFAVGSVCKDRRPTFSFYREYAEASRGKMLAQGHVAKTLGLVWIRTREREMNDKEQKETIQRPTVVGQDLSSVRKF